jgi:site-specific DNA recombinase
LAQGAVEAAVVERIRALARDPALLDEVVRAAHAEVAAQRADLRRDAQRSGTAAARLQGEIDDLVAHGADVPELRQRLEELRQAHDAAAGRATTAKDALAALRACVMDEAALRRAIESVAPCWEALFPAERARLIRLLVERVSVDARTGEVDIAFHPGGVGDQARR